MFAARVACTPDLSPAFSACQVQEVVYSNNKIAAYRVLDADPFCAWLGKELKRCFRLAQIVMVELKCRVWFSWNLARKMWLELTFAWIWGALAVHSTRCIAEHISEWLFDEKDIVLVELINLIVLSRRKYCNREMISTHIISEQELYSYRQCWLSVLPIPYKQPNSHWLQYCPTSLAETCPQPLQSSAVASKSMRDSIYLSIRGEARSRWACPREALPNSVMTNDHSPGVSLFHSILLRQRRDLYKHNCVLCMNWIVCLCGGSDRSFLEIRPFSHNLI